MKRVMVRYKVKPGCVEENEELVKRVFAALALAQPDGVAYSTFKLADGVSFVHIASYETADGSNPITSLPEFKVFSSGVKDRCDEPPVSTELTEVGSFR
jgi:hypothetical protein